MKYLLTFALTLICISLAYTQSGDCVIFSPTGEFFHIALDNKFQNAKSHRNIRIKNIPEGDYWVTILFQDKNKKAIKTNMKLRAGREISYRLELDGGVWRLNEHSNIPKVQAAPVSSSQMNLSYNTEGVEVLGVKSATDIPKEMVQKSTEINRIQGERTYDSKREGKFTISERSGSDTAPASSTPQEEPETGTKITTEYVEVDNGDGTTSIIEQRTTAFKEVVTKNGQRFLRTKKKDEQFDTDFTCLPMKKEAFIALKETVTNADNKAEAATNGIKDKCMTPNQLKALSNIITDKAAKNNFAIAAKEVCASPSQFPFTIEEPVIAVVEEKPEPTVEEVEEEVKEIIEEKPKTKAELKAELKAAKAREKAEKKAAKAKAKAEKKAAREKAKAEKAAAKAAAKKAKEEAKNN